MQNIANVFFKYYVNVIWFAAYAAGWIWLLIRTLKERQRSQAGSGPKEGTAPDNAEDPAWRTRLYFLVMSALITLAVLNPISYKVIQKGVGSTYWRLLWMVPELPVMALAAADLLTLPVESVKRRLALRIGCMILAAVILLTGGSYMYRPEIYQKASNNYKLPQVVLKIGDVLLEQEEEPMAVVPNTIYCYIRQYSSKIHLMFGRDSDGYIAKKRMSDAAAAVAGQMKTDFPDMALVTQLMRENGYKYIVTAPYNVIDQGWMAEQGYALIEIVDGYPVYADTRMPSGE